MKICILGNGLTSLTLAKSLVNKGIYVDIFSNSNLKIQNNNRTIGISKSNLEFFNKDILNIQNKTWDINEIEVYSENFYNEKILSFKNNNQKVISMVKNSELINKLLSELKKNKLFNFYKKEFSQTMMNNDYKLIFNCDFNNFITKKFFYKKIIKDYDSNAFTSTINHKRVDNNTAVQVFTTRGPLAFLPISHTKTSIVYSVKGSNKINFENLVKKYNFKYDIVDIQKPSSFKLKSFVLRSYYHKNIIAFGDLLHKLHPLAGQGFNMTLRDIKEILRLIDLKIENGLDIDISICSDFEKNMRHKNYLFLNGIDFIYEFFNFENKTKNNLLSKSIKFIGKNKMINQVFTKFADNGLVI